jgi:hypothetical protein
VLVELTGTLPDKPTSVCIAALGRQPTTIMADERGWFVIARRSSVTNRATRVGGASALGRGGDP